MTSHIFHFSSSRPQCPKLHVSTGKLPAYIDPLQPQSKKAPWHVIRNAPFVHAVDLLMSEELYNLIWQKLDHSLTHVEYCKVIMGLEDILTGDFFTEYIKKGNILMLSEGNASSGDTIISLSTGILRIDMDRIVYERSGLPNGTPVPSGGQKHTKSRFRVEYDLRAPSMLRGKKVFDRLLYAAKNTPGLLEGRCWLFHDLVASVNEVNTKPINTHHPTVVRNESCTTELKKVMIPSAITRSVQSQMPTPVMIEEDFFELTEWIDLVKAGSPRICSGDTVDPFISRYVLPGAMGEMKVQDLRKLSWKGLLGSTWISKLLNEIIRQTRLIDAKHWMCLSTTAHPIEAVGQVEGYTILFQPITMAEIDMEDSINVDSGAENTQYSKEQSQAGRGLQDFIQFHFVDTMTT